MNPDEIPLPLEKTVTVKNGVVEVSITEAAMSSKEKKAYKKFMAKCVAESGKDKKEAMMSCAVDFKKMKEKLVAEEIEEEEEEDEKEEEDEMEEEDECEGGKKLKKK